MDLLSIDFLAIAPILLASSAVTGFLAGAFGVGGGALMVPVLIEALTRGRLELALGIFLGFVSLRFLYAILTG